MLLLVIFDCYITLTILIMNIICLKIIHMKVNIDNYLILCVYANTFTSKASINFPFKQRMNNWLPILESE